MVPVVCCVLVGDMAGVGLDMGPTLTQSYEGLREGS